jgi:hypothetical protein
MAMSQPLIPVMASPPRVFTVDHDGMVTTLTVHEYVSFVGISDDAHAAYDIMADDGVPLVKAWQMAMTMDRMSAELGSAEFQARHLVELRRAIR